MGLVQETGFHYNPLPTFSVEIAKDTYTGVHQDQSLVRGIRGPVGSGKTYGCCADIFFHSMWQYPYLGVRKTRWAFIRSTYPELLNTTLKTWKEGFGDFSKIRESPTVDGLLNMHIGPVEGQEHYGDTDVEAELHFIAMDKERDLEKLRSFEFTGFFLNEATELALKVVTRAIERRGRYPKKIVKDGNVVFAGASWSGVIMDTNSCDDSHWWYQYAEELRPKGWSFYAQPAALLWFKNQIEMEKYLRAHPEYPAKFAKMVAEDIKGGLYIPNPHAENVHNLSLGYQYYLDMIPGKPIDEIKVFILNQYGTIVLGKPVHPEYDDEIHCAKEDLVPMQNVGLNLGFDFGLTPACSIGQIGPNGKLYVLDEKLVTEHGAMGIRAFSRVVLVPYLLDNYRHWLEEGIVEAYGDPAGTGRAQTDEKTCFMILLECPFTKPEGRPNYKENAAKLKDESYFKKIRAAAERGEVSLGDIGVRSKPAHTNSPVARRDALKKFLIHKAITVSPKCKYIRKGLRGKFQFPKIQASGDARYSEVAEKNIWSHICESLEYQALEAEYQAIDPKAIQEKKEEKAKIEKLTGASLAAYREIQEIKRQIEEQGEYYGY